MKSQPFLAPVIGLISGIVLSESFRTNGLSEIRWLLPLFLLLIVFFGFKKKQLFTLLILILLMVYGFLFSMTYNQRPTLNWQLPGEKSLTELKINETFRSSEKFRKYSVQVLSVNGVTVNRTNALLYWPKTKPELFQNDQTSVFCRISQTKKPLNPFQFDYSKYLERKRIYFTIFQVDSIVSIKEASGFYHSSSVFKTKFRQKLIQNGYSKPTIDLIGAMLLGDRTEMNADIEEDFRRTGVVHLLAISGLHIMMVFSIFMFVFYPMIYLKNGKKIRIVISLILIWSFVAFVDFRPPVFRSALMISIYFISILLKRKPNIYHTLLVSAMVLLLYNPNFLFDPGFILSFSAVFFIVFFNPVYQHLFKPRQKFSKKIIGFVGTTVSAQMGTLPFSVFFFNQTSGLFLAGNVVMIAASYLMVWGGVITVVLTVLGLDIGLWRLLFDSFIGLCISYVHWLSTFDDFVFDRLSISGAELFLLITGLLMIRLIVFKPKASHLFLFLTLIFIFEGQRVYRLVQLNRKQEIIVFHQNRATVIGVRKGNFWDVYLSDLNDSTQVEKYTIKPYEIHQKIKKKRFLALENGVSGFYKKDKNVIEYHNKRLIIYSKSNDSLLRNGDFILARNNTKPDSIGENMELIIDGSNYPDFSKNLKQKNVWITGKNGAKIINIR